MCVKFCDIGLGMQPFSSAVVTLSRKGPPRVGSPITRRSRPERQPLRLLALKPLPHLLGAGAIQFFKPAHLPLLENEIDINPLIQATHTNRLQVLRGGGPG